MKLLRDLSIYTTGDYTVIETEKMCKVITRGRIGYYDKTGDPIEKLETAIENTDGHLIEDADYFDGFDHVQYRITIKEIDGSYIVLDEYSSPINYATAMIEYFSKMVENPQWVAFSTIKSTFSFSDGGKIVKITDNGKIIDVGPHVDPITYLTAEHFNKQVFKNNYSMFIPRNCQMIRLHPLEVGYACESDVVKLFKTDGLSQQWCIYDGDSNYICTDNEIILEKRITSIAESMNCFGLEMGKNTHYSNSRITFSSNLCQILTMLIITGNFTGNQKKSRFIKNPHT